MSLRWRLIGGIVLLLSALWSATTVWFFFDIRSELREVLDARLASSASMVQGLISRGDLRLPLAAATEALPPAASRPLSLPTELACQLWTLEGRLISAARNTPALPASEIPEGFSNRLVAGEPWRVYALTDWNNGVRIITAERQSLRLALVGDVAKAVSAPFLIVLPATILLVWVAVRRGLVPLERLRRSIVARNAGALEPIGEQGVPAEVLPLVGALNGLFARVTEAFERERHFTGDAAHELRTPLAGIKAQLQIAQSADGAIRERALRQAEEGVDRMSRLVSQMLLLARLETEPEELSEPDFCEAGDELRAVLQTLRPLVARREVQLLLQNATVAAAVQVPASMLHAALRNLLENSIHHTPPGKQVTITTELTPAQLRLRIVDEGPGIPPEALARITRRFYRVAVANTGTGLGLSIVAAIAQRYGMRLHLENRPERAGLISGLDIPRRFQLPQP